MRTAYQTGPGYYAAGTPPHDAAIPEGHVRIYCVRMEAYDIEKHPGGDGDDVKFELLFSMCEGDPVLARALLKLGRAVNANRPALERAAKDKG